jgi:hypothetical protein
MTTLRLVKVLGLCLVLSGAAAAKGGPKAEPKSTTTTKKAAASDAKLGCNFKLDLSKHKGLKAASWKEFNTTTADREKYVEPGEGKGKVRCAQTFKATAGAVLFRRYDSGKTPNGAGKTGRSWNLVHTANSPTYRREMEICHAWNDLAHEVKCTIKPGKVAYLYIGPGESVSEKVCGRAGESYPRAAALQVLFHSDPKDVCDLQ